MVESNVAFIVFAAISPMLISLVKQQGWPPQVNALVAFACYIIVGVVGALANGAPTAETLASFIATANVIGVAAYSLIWSNLGTGPAGTDPSVEKRLTAATSLVK